MLSCSWFHWNQSNFDVDDVSYSSPVVSVGREDSFSFVVGPRLPELILVVGVAAVDCSSPEFSFLFDSRDVFSSVR